MRPVQIQRHPGSPIQRPLCVAFLPGWRVVRRGSVGVMLAQPAACCSLKAVAASAGSCSYFLSLEGTPQEEKLLSKSLMCCTRRDGVSCAPCGEHPRTVTLDAGVMEEAPRFPLEGCGGPFRAQGWAQAHTGS